MPPPNNPLHTDDNGTARCWWCAGDPLYLDYHDAGIIRHRGKIESTINNAKRAIELVEEHGSLAAFVWQFEPQDRGCPKKIPSQSPESVALSKAFKSQGWTFVGPATAYAFMQAMMQSTGQTAHKRNT